MLERRPPNEELRERRQAAHMSFNDCERELGVSISMMSRLELGQRKPGIKTAMILNKAFGIPLSDWVTPEEWEEVDAFKAGWQERYDAKGEADKLAKRELSRLKREPTASP